MATHSHDPKDPGHGRELVNLLRDYGASWEIEAYPGGLDAYTATHKSGDGRHVRVLVAHTIGELRAKLDTAGTVEP